MTKFVHEIRDPIYNFILIDSHERKVLDSPFFQRLRYVHQLALTYLVYPGATHRRFEHSLGVMELAGRAYDVITNPNNIDKRCADIFPNSEDERLYWRRVVRMAALCHDLGHLPFSHAAEHDMLPKGFSHEILSKKIIESPEMVKIWGDMVPPVKTEHVYKLAVGEKELREEKYSVWESILSEIIVGNAFGVDRMDYLLRDSHHAGVSYGKFDHYRLIDTIRVLPKEEDSDEPTLGIEEGGLHSAEALVLARYFMFTQLYCHRIRRVFDIHLKDFLSKWRSKKDDWIDLDKHLQTTDTEVLGAMRLASVDNKNPAHEPALRIIERKPFWCLYERNAADLAINPDAAKCVYEQAKKEYGEENVKIDPYKKSTGGVNFPVKLRDGRIATSINVSQTLSEVPTVAVEYIFINPDLRAKAEKWLTEKRYEIISPKGEEQ